MTEQEIINMVNEVLGDVDEMSPYRLSKMVSVVIGKKVQGPMVYNYCDKKYIKSHKNSLGHLVITREDAAEWMVKYSTKKLVK